MDSQIEEIKNKLNVLDIVGNYVKLTKTGVNYRGICPFHSEKGPSFFVSPTRQMWKCFGCGLGGDIFEFIKKIEGVEFGDALRLLAAKAGVELKRENPQIKSQRKRLYEICNLACSFFEKQLASSASGKLAKDYLLKRGIKEESIKKWRLGYSPDTWQGLSDFLVGRGYTREEIVSAGLAVKSEKGNNPYDRFRGRIIFPVFDLNSQVVGFGARIFSGNQNQSQQQEETKTQPKYINTPQTLLYDKSNILYGMNFAKLATRKTNQCVLTEGYTDAIMCHQAGFENTVAVSGTALTPNHLNVLKRYTDNLLLSFDMDVAGDTATKRGINLAQTRGFNIKVVNAYDNAKDPAEIILENPKNWQGSVEDARAIMDFYFDSAFAKFSVQGATPAGGDNLTPVGKKEIGKILLPAIKRIQNKIEQSYWAQKLAEKLNVSQDAVLQEMALVSLDQGSNSEFPQRGPQTSGFAQVAPVGRKKLLEEKIVSLALKDPGNLNFIEESHYGLFGQEIKDLIQDMKSIVLKRGNDAQAIFTDLPKDKYKDILDALAFKAEVDYPLEYGKETDNEIRLCLLQLKEVELRNVLNNISMAIGREQDEEKRNNLIKEFCDKAKELHHQKI